MAKRKQKQGRDAFTLSRTIPIKKLKSGEYKILVVEKRSEGDHGVGSRRYGISEKLEVVPPKIQLKK